MARQPTLDRSTPRVSRCLRWAQRHLPDYFSDAAAAFHDELLAELEQGTRLVARVAPRGHAKSTCVALAYPLWCIVRRRRRNIVVLTHESGLARQFVRDIRHELETNERIRAAHGELCAAQPRSARRKWTESMFTAANGVTVQARSAGASFRGSRVGPQRPDLVICDDIEDDEQVASPEGRRKLELWLRRVVMPALAPEGQIVLVGSLLHYDSLLANLANRARWPRWDYRVYRALEAEPSGADGFELRALWPARWPVERLQEERERIGTLAFEQEYQANPIDDTLRVFRTEWLRRWKPAELSDRRLVTLLAIDPATGASGGDFFAIWVGSVDVDSGVIYTRALTLERIGIVEQVKRIVAAWERWKPARIGIEVNAYQAALRDVLEDYGRRHRLYLPLTPLHTVSNKRARIEGLAPLLEAGTLRLPEQLDPEVEAQFLQFPKSRHDDAPDVCTLGVELARTLRGGPTEAQTASRPLFSRGGAW